MVQCITSAFLFDASHWSLDTLEAWAGYNYPQKLHSCILGAFGFLVLGKSGSIVHGICFFAHPFHPPIYQFLVLLFKLPRTLFRHVELKRQGDNLVMDML